MHKAEYIERAKQNQKFYKKEIEKNKRQYRTKNKEKINKYNKNYYIRHKEEIKQYYELHKKEISENHKLRNKNRIKNDVIFKIICWIRYQNYRAIQYIKREKDWHSIETLGCTIGEFKKYIESLFKTGMNWENHGEWHIDHIVPLCTAKTKEDIFKLNHYTNLQPLWTEENIKKSSKIL